MFIRALITMLAADTVDRHMREQQHKAWLAEYEARAAAAARAAVASGSPLAYDPARPERST
jgi:post-segregation antitoxin (ccd killing protein)